MTDLLLIASLAGTAGFQSGVMASWRYYRKQRDEHDEMRRHYEREIELLEVELERERRERRRVLEEVRHTDRTPRSRHR